MYDHYGRWYPQPPPPKRGLSASTIAIFVGCGLFAVLAVVGATKREKPKSKPVEAWEPPAYVIELRKVYQGTMEPDDIDRSCQKFVCKNYKTSLGTAYRMEIVGHPNRKKVLVSYETGQEENKDFAPPGGIVKLPCSYGIFPGEGQFYLVTDGPLEDTIIQDFPRQINIGSRGYWLQDSGVDDDTRDCIRQNTPS